MKYKHSVKKPDMLNSGKMELLYTANAKFLFEFIAAYKT